MTDGERKALFLAQPPLIAVPTAAKILGLSRASAYRYADNGGLPAVRMGSRVYVIKEKIRPIVMGEVKLAVES